MPNLRQKYQCSVTGVTNYYFEIGTTNKLAGFCVQTSAFLPRSDCLTETVVVGWFLSHYGSGTARLLHGLGKPLLRPPQEIWFAGCQCIAQTDDAAAACICNVNILRAHVV